MHQHSKFLPQKGGHSTGRTITACVPLHVPTPADTMPLFPTVSTYYPLGSLTPRRNAVLKKKIPVPHINMELEIYMQTVTHLYKYVQLYEDAVVYILKFTYFLKVVSSRNPHYRTTFCFSYPGFKVNRQVGLNVLCFFLFLWQTCKLVRTRFYLA